MQSSPIGLRGGLNTFTFAGGNPVNLVDPTGEGPISRLAIAGFCEGCNVRSLYETFETLDALKAEVEQLNNLIDVAEQYCSVEKRPQWLQSRIEQPKRDSIKIVDKYMRENGNIFPAQIVQTIVCGALGALLTLNPAIP